MADADGLTEANVKGWDSAEALGTFLVGLFIFPVFFFWQTRIDPIDALVKPRTWSVLLRPALLSIRALGH